MYCNEFKNVVCMNWLEVLMFSLVLGLLIIVIVQLSHSEEKHEGLN